MPGTVATLRATSPTTPPPLSRAFRGAWLLGVLVLLGPLAGCRGQYTGSFQPDPNGNTNSGSGDTAQGGGGDGGSAPLDVQAFPAEATAWSHGDPSPDEQAL